MSINRLRSVAGIAALSVAAPVFAACNKVDSNNASSGLPSKDGALGSAIASATGDAKPDPCTLLSGNEAEVYVGVLVSPPYRVTDDGVPNVSGETCMYRGSDGRQVTIFRGAGGGAAGKATATTHRVMADVQGPWDHATWTPGGSLMVTKGDAATNIDVSAASGKEDDAVAIAKQIVPRLDHPLDHNGAIPKTGMDNMKMDSNASKMIGGLMRIVVGMDLQSADYEKAKALMAAICSRL